MATVGGFLLFLANDFASVLAGSMLLFAGLAGISPMLDARTLETLGSGKRHRYGQVRAFGSLGFVVVSLLVGLLLDSRGARTLFWVYLPLLIGTVIVTATIKRVGTSRPVSLFRGTSELLAVPGVVVFFAGFTVVWTALSATNTFYSIQIVALGGGAALVGFAWAFGALIEVPLMYAFPRLGSRFGTERLLVVGAVVLAIRSLLAALAGDALGLILIAPLEGLGFACVFVGGVTVLGARVPPSLGGTAQGVFSACAGLATIAGSAAGGAIAGAVGISGNFAAWALIGLVGAGILGYAALGVRRAAEPPAATPGTDPGPVV